MPNQNTTAEQTYRILMIIWFALFMTQFMFFVVIYLAKPELFSFDFTKGFLGDNPPVILAFALVGVSNLMLSIFLRKKFVDRAIEEQRPALVQTGMIIGCALSESITLIGLFLAFAFSYQYFFIFISLGIVGMIFHFPQRDTIHQASFKGGKV